MFGLAFVNPNVLLGAEMTISFLLSFLPPEVILGRSLEGNTHLVPPIINYWCDQLKQDVARVQNIRDVRK